MDEYLIFCRDRRIQWKWIHTLCPEIEEYGGFHRLEKYCLRCLENVCLESSSDWRSHSFTKQMIKYENCKMRSLQNLCIKQIIERNIEITRLPDSIKKRICELNEQLRHEDYCIND